MNIKYILRLLVIIYLLSCVSAFAEQRGQIVIDTFADLNGAFPPDTQFRYSRWSNNTGQIVYIHSAELKMYTEMNDMEGRMSSGAELLLSSGNPARNGAYVLWGSLYCVQTDPTIVAKTFDPEPLVLQPGEGLLLRYYASYPNLLSTRFFDGVIIWYSVGQP